MCVAVEVKQKKEISAFKSDKVLVFNSQSSKHIRNSASSSHRWQCNPEKRNHVAKDEDTKEDTVYNDEHHKEIKSLLLALKICMPGMYFQRIKPLMLTQGVIKL